MAGDGEKWNEIATEAKKTQLGDTCVMPGTLNEEGVKALLQQTSIYVHSTLSETMSTSIMQAMACGLPVIATEIEGTKNMIRAGENGLLVPPGDVAALANAIESLIENPEKTAQLGMNARRHAVDFFSNEKMFMGYHRLLHSPIKAAPIAAEGF